MQAVKRARPMAATRDGRSAEVSLDERQRGDTASGIESETRAAGDFLDFRRPLGG